MPQLIFGCARLARFSARGWLGFTRNLLTHKQMAGDLTIGIDLGGTQVRAALVKDGVILRRASARTDVSGGPVAVLGQFKQLMSEVCPPAEWAGVAGVGVAAPGPLD